MKPVTLISQLAQLLVAELALRLAQYGFRHSGQTFWQELGDHRCFLHVSAIRHSESFEVTVDVAVRHHAIEDLLNSERGDLRPREKKQTATVGVELGNWSQGQPQLWTVSTPAEVAGVAADIVDWFRRIGVPFLERFASLDEIVRVLEAEGPEASLICPLKDVRDKIRLAARIVRTERSN